MGECGGSNKKIFKNKKGSLKKKEYAPLIKEGWTTKQWRAQGGYANVSRTDDNRGKINKSRETLYFSPHCLQNKILF